MLVTGSGSQIFQNNPSSLDFSRILNFPRFLGYPPEPKISTKAVRWQLNLIPPPQTTGSSRPPSEAGSLHLFKARPTTSHLGPWPGQAISAGANFPGGDPVSDEDGGWGLASHQLVRENKFCQPGRFKSWPIDTETAQGERPLARLCPLHARGCRRQVNGAEGSLPKGQGLGRGGVMDKWEGKKYYAHPGFGEKNTGD